MQKSIFLILFSMVFLTAIFAKEIPRKIARIYNSDDQLSIIDNELDRGLEMATNYLGLKMEYIDLAKGLPSDEEMEEYYASIVWLFDYNFEGAKEFWTWQKRQFKNGKRSILLQQPRPGLIRQTGEEAQADLINSTLREMNFEINLHYSDFTPDISIVSINSEMAEFERSLTYEIPHFYESKSLSDENEVFLRLRLNSEDMYSDCIVSTPKGGIIMGDFVYYMDPYTFKKQWRVNPFKFISKSLGITNHPRLDYTTMNGRRIFYSHIDGDGFNNATSALKNNKKATSAEVVFEKVLKKYNSTPITVSVITAEMDPKKEGRSNSISLARKIFSLPNIEPASHTYTHPLVWNKTMTHASDIQKYENVKKIEFHNNAMTMYRPEGYVYSPTAEITDSVAYINENLLPSNKKCELLLWSGNCLPSLREMDIIHKENLMNINGGDSRLDDLHPSYLYMAPLYRKVGPYYQIYTSNANDNLYIEEGNPASNGSFQTMITTFKRSETPMRVAPINIYYHFFSGSTIAGTQALINLYDWALSQSIFPMYTSDYYNLVQGFIDAKLYEYGENHWGVENNKNCRTLRFDDSKLYPDLKQSKGVLGFKHYQGNLYVSLTDDLKKEIVLSKKPPKERFLSEASGNVNNLSGLQKNTIQFESYLFGDTQFIWKNFPKRNEVTVHYQVEGSEMKQINTHVLDDGTLDFTLIGLGKCSVSLVINEKS
jgi:polysaccharide biosynthesis protein PelA